MNNLTTRERIFLIVFLPLFALKLFDITADNFFLKLAGVAGFGIFMLFVSNQIYSKNFLRTFIILLVYTGLLVITTGKQAAFFSIVIIWLMYRVNMDKRLYRLLFRFGLVVLVLAILIAASSKVETTTRYINGEWVEMTKRNNILFVSFTAIVSLYLLCHRFNLSKKHIYIIAVASFLMFGFVGSRTGLIVMLLLIVMLTAFQKNNIFRNKLVRCLCILSPLYCMFFCIYTGLAYKTNPLLLILDMMLQGRIYQNYLFMTNYKLLPFGQHIIEESGGGNF